MDVKTLNLSSMSPSFLLLCLSCSLHYVQERSPTQPSTSSLHYLSAFFYLTPLLSLFLWFIPWLNKCHWTCLWCQGLRTLLWFPDLFRNCACSSQRVLGLSSLVFFLKSTGFDCLLIFVVQDPCSFLRVWSQVACFCWPWGTLGHKPGEEHQQLAVHAGSPPH